MCKIYAVLKLWKIQNVIHWDAATRSFQRCVLVMLDTLGVKALLTLWVNPHKYPKCFSLCPQLGHQLTEWQLIATYKKSALCEENSVAKDSHSGQNAANIYQITSSQKRLFPWQVMCQISCTWKWPQVLFFLSTFPHLYQKSIWLFILLLKLF